MKRFIVRLWWSDEDYLETSITFDSGYYDWETAADWFENNGITLEVSGAIPTDSSGMLMIQEIETPLGTSFRRVVELREGTSPPVFGR